MLRLASTAQYSKLPCRENGTVANETLHPLFVDHFREYVEKKLGESFNGLNDVLRSKFMSRFFAEKILAPRNPIIPTVEETFWPHSRCEHRSILHRKQVRTIIHLKESPSRPKFASWSDNIYNS
jgi:hypothetical protein